MSDTTGLKRILLLDDDSDFRILIITFLRKMFEGVELVEYDPIANGVPDEDFDWSQYDVLLLDYYLCVHGVTGLDILQKNRKNKMFPATIMLTGAGNEEVAVRALKSGVYDYLRKEQLDKEELRNSILDAHEEHKVKRAKLNELTTQSHAFNKSLFYQQLEQAEDPSKKRLLLLIEIDDHEGLEERLGIILRDNIIRHIAKCSFEMFKMGECNPSITRFSDYSVALIIDDPGSDKTMQFNMEGICTFLKKTPYKFEGKKYNYTVSIGTVPIAVGEHSAEEFIKRAKIASEIASKNEGNTYHLFTEQDLAQPATPDEPVQESVAEITETVTEASPEPQSEAPEVKETTAEPEPAPKPVPEKPKAVAKEAAPKPVAEPKSAPVEKAKPEAAAPQKPVAPTKPAPVKAKTVVEKPAVKKEKPAEKDEAELNEAELDEAALKIKKAFDEKRVVQTYIPIISLSDEVNDEQEVYKLSIQLIDKGGSIIHANDIEKDINTPAFQKFLDRWMLREAIGRITNSNPGQYLFLIKLSEASLADATLFNWLRKLLSGLDSRDPGKSIVIELSASDFSAKQKQAGALISYLNKSHGFRFVLSYIDKADEVSALTSSVNFNMLRLDKEMVPELNEISTDDEENKTLMQLLKSKGTNIIADGINDATMLTDSISAGADYAMGEFIGEEINQLDDTTNVESFEIT